MLLVTKQKQKPNHQEIEDFKQDIPLVFKPLPDKPLLRRNRRAAHPPRVVSRRRPVRRVVLTGLR